MCLQASNAKLFVGGDSDRKYDFPVIVYDLQRIAGTISLRSIFLVAKAFVVVVVVVVIVIVIMYIIDVCVDALTCRSGAAIPQRFADSVHVD
jgi:hypothetical protein